MAARNLRTFVPRMLTDEELRKFFRAVDTLEPTARSPLRHLITPSPFLSGAAAAALDGRELTADTIHEAAHAARLDARPLDNTDLDFSWRRAMVEVWVRRTLEEARSAARAMEGR